MSKIIKEFVFLIIVCAASLVFTTIANAQSTTSDTEAAPETATQEPEKKAPENTAPAKKVAAQEPDLPLEEQVTKVLNKHCASCHSAPKNQGNFNFVLDLPRLVETSRYITPRHPEISFLMTRIRNQTMPPSGNAKLNDKEMKIISDWISQVQTSREKTAQKRTTIKRDDLLVAMRDDLDLLSREERLRTRYFTIHNLYNAGDSGKQLELWRRSITKVLNSLTWQSIVRPVRLGPKKVLLRVNLDDLGWPDIVWDRLLAEYPYGVVPEDIAKDLSHRTGTPQPFLRADWMAYNATRPPLYYDILGLPKTTSELEKVIGVNSERNIKKFRVARAGFRESGVSQNNRLIERHPLERSSGMYWKSYDFGSNAERSDIFKYPLGPGGKNGFVHDGGEMIFSLPNGFQAYYLATADDKRINVGPTNIVRDKSRPLDPDIINGISCMGCHMDGMILTQDQVRNRVNVRRHLRPDLRHKVERLHPKWPEMQKLMFRDMQRYLIALDNAGVISGFSRTDAGGFKVKRVINKEAVRALSDRYDETVTMLQGAAELGMTVQQFEDEINRASDKVREMKEELARGTLPRDVFEAGYKSLLPNALGLTSLDHTESCRHALRKTSQSYIPKTPYITSCNSSEVTKISVTKKPKPITKPEPNRNEEYFKILKTCLNRAADKLSDRVIIKGQISCVETYRKDAKPGNRYESEVAEYLAELKTAQAKYKKTVVTPDPYVPPKKTSPIEPFIPPAASHNGYYSGVRGYTDRGRRSPRRFCKNRYTFTATIRNGRISFNSDGRHWNGRVSSNGSITIRYSDVSPRPKHPISVRGPKSNAYMHSGYCGAGYFKLYK